MVWRYSIFVLFVWRFIIGLWLLVVVVICFVGSVFSFVCRCCFYCVYFVVCFLILRRWIRLFMWRSSFCFIKCFVEVVIKR